MITEAREQSTGMVAEAQRSRAQLLDGLDRERDLLERKIDELRTFERDYRARLKAHLESQLLELEQTGLEGQTEAEDPSDADDDDSDDDNHDQGSDHGNDDDDDHDEDVDSDNDNKKPFGKRQFD